MAGCVSILRGRFWALLSLMVARALADFLSGWVRINQKFRQIAFFCCFWKMPILHDTCTNSAIFPNEADEFGHERGDYFTFSGV